MPVTAKLSRRFYEKLGDDVANELVEWFNSVDATYRADLRELNELNFARFDAKLEQRIAELEGRVNARLGLLEGKIESSAAATRAHLVKWMFVFWTGTALTVIGAVLGLVPLLVR